MMYVALRFFLDPNLCERTYWYGSEFPLEEGDEVFAPVGVHDKLQCGRVERTSKLPPMEISLMKRTVAKADGRVFLVDNVRVCEFGGIRYDGKHFTRFFRLLVTEEQEPPQGLKKLGVTEQIPADENALSRIATCRGFAVLYGERANGIARNLIEILRGGKSSENEREISLFHEKFD